MKPLKIIFTLLIIILLTSCVGQKQLNIDELLKKYNSITESELESSMFTVYKSGNDFVYKRIEGSALLCLYAAKDGEITQCTVTVKNNGMPTLKRKVKEEDIARPTLSDTDNFTKIIRQ